MMGADHVERCVSVERRVSVEKCVSVIMNGMMGGFDPLFRRLEMMSLTKL
jgi:hypothetical protein